MSFYPLYAIFTEGTEKDAEKEIEMWIGKGPGNPHLLEEGAQNEL